MLKWSSDVKKMEKKIGQLVRAVVSVLLLAVVAVTRSSSSIHGDFIDLTAPVGGELTEALDTAAAVTLLKAVDSVSLKQLNLRVVNVACGIFGGELGRLDAFTKLLTGDVGLHVNAAPNAPAPVTLVEKSITRFSSSSSSSLTPLVPELCGDESGLAISTALAFN